MYRIADYLAEELWNLGVRKVFGLPGGENVQLLDALDRRGFAFHLVRNESSAAYAAAACYRVTGQPQACLTTLGPGITHGTAGLGHLWLDRAAVVFLTARTGENSGPLHTHQVLDLSALAGPLSKKSLIVLPDSVQQVAGALSLMLEGRPGPVHLQMSNEAGGQPCARPSQTRPDPRIPAEKDHLIEAARACIRDMRKPVIVAGLGVRSPAAAAALKEAAEALQSPVLATPKAKGAVSDLDPLSAGVIGLTKTDPAYAILDSADGVIAVGFDVVELVKHWDWEGPLVWVADWPNQDPPLPATVELHGPPENLLPALTMKESGRAVWHEEDFAPRVDAAACFDAGSEDSDHITPQQLLGVLRESVPRSTRLTVDVGSHKIFLSLDWPTFEPNGFLLSNGLSCMGYGLASAVGASIEDPGRLIVCVTGDGGMAMCAGELALLQETGGRVIVVVLKDAALDLIRSAQTRAGMPALGTEFEAEVDHVKLAQAYGVRASRSTSVQELRDALQEAVSAEGAYLIECVLDPAGYPTTP